MSNEQCNQSKRDFSRSVHSHFSFDDGLFSLASRLLKQWSG